MPKYQPRAVGIDEGDNDIAAGFIAEYVASRMEQIASRITCRFPNARICIISIKPSPLRWGVWAQMKLANQLLVDSCATNARYRFVGAASALLPRPEYDAPYGLHLSAAGHTAWNGVVRSALMAGEQASIGGTADALRYACQLLTGRGQITARVMSQRNSPLWAKAGVICLSANGITWTTRGIVPFSSLPSTVYVGLAASSYGASSLGTVAFDRVSRSP